MQWRSELQNEFSWSKSRDALFATCLRAYYYHYYGSWNGWRRDAPADVRELYIMKNLQSISTWRGGLVHDVVKEVITGISERRPLSADQATKAVRERVRRDLNDSTSGRYRSRPNRRCGLQEHYYSLPISDESLSETVAIMERCVESLLGTRTYSAILELGPESIMEFEKLRSMTLSGCKVWVSPDVIVRGPDDSVMIVDWKTGLSTVSRETKLQLAIYGIYTARTYNLPLDQLLGVEENLRLDERHIFPLDTGILEETRRYIEDSVHSMQGLLHDRERNIALIRDFPTTEDPSVCRDCRFRRACDRE